MQHFSNPVIATNERIIIWAVLGFGEEHVFVIIIIILIIIITNYGHVSQWTVTIGTDSQSHFNKRSDMKLVKIGQVVSEEKLYTNIMILYMYTTHGQGKVNLVA